MPWGRLLFQVVSLRIPKDLVPESEDARETCEWWKAKKWAFGCLNRLFTRYGNPSQLPGLMKKEYMAFAQHFVTAFAPEIFKAYLQQVELFVSGQEWISRKCQCAILSYFSEWCVTRFFLAVAKLSQCEAKEHVGAAQAALPDARVVVRVPAPVLHGRAPRTVDVGPYRVRAHEHRCVFFAATRRH